MNRITAGLIGAVAIVSLTAIAFAHEVTYRGTVVALQATKYAQPDGGVREVQELEVTIVDAKTKKPANRVFAILGSTRVLRAGKRMTLAQAAVQKGDSVEVVIDHDKPGDEAIEVRLTAAR